LRLFKDIFREVEAFHYKCEAFIKITRLFEDIFREMEALIRNLRFLKTFSMELRLFKSDLRLSKNPRLFKLFPEIWRLFSLM
jgi:hypothetical protein